MPGILLFLVGALCALSVSAIPNHELIKNLSSRLHELPEGRGTLIKSFSNHTQSYIYDQALAIITFTKENDLVTAKKLLHGLESLQLADGSLYFSYYLDGKSPYPQEGDKRFAGAISWVALAAIHFQHKFKSKDFLAFNYRLLTYLHTQMQPIRLNGNSIKALSFAPSDIKSTPWAENETAALEHNLDAYAAFLHFTEINKTTKWQSDVKDLKKFILNMWDKDRSHFWSGANLKTGHINKSELYLDNQTWSLLALDSATLKEINPSEALKLNCETLFVEHEGINGLMDSKPARRPASSQFVWSEGTLGQILAMRKLRKMENRTIYCNEKTSTELLGSIKKMKKSDGGIAYSTTTVNPDFTTSSSVAGTAWLYFASNDFNPFHIEGLN
jgi:hypothetical protein